MPFTFAHPAAVLPFRRFCPSILHFPALVVGSMTPDAGYYLHNWQWAVLGHSFVGSVTFDVPAGMIFLSLFYLSLRPVAAVLPAPHRQTVLSWCPQLKWPGLVRVLTMCFSIILGAWTHIVWDGFTHANGWCVRNFSALTPTVLTIGSYEVTLWQLLQHASTFFGFYLLWQAYTAHIQEVNGTATLTSDASDRFAAVTVLILPAVFACLLSATSFHSGINMFNVASFAYTAAIHYVDFLLPSLLVAGLTLSVYRILVRWKLGKLLFAPPYAFSGMVVLAQPEPDVIPPVPLQDPVVVSEANAHGAVVQQ